MKKFSSLLLAFMMIMSLTVSVFASELYTGSGKIVVQPGENKEIEFTGSFGGPFVVAFSDQGQVLWSGLESGVKDFSFNLNPIDSIIKEHPNVQFINFPGHPKFIAPANVQFTISVNDTVVPTLYMVKDDGTILGVPDVTIGGSNNKKFEFKTDELAKTYIISDVDLSYVTAPSTVTPEPTPEPVVETPPVVEEVPSPEAPAPQTGINDVFYIMMIAAGCVGLSILLISKKKNG